MKKFLFALFLICVTAGFVWAGYKLLEQDSIVKARQKRTKLDIPTTVVALHKQALDGTLELMDEKQIGMTLIEAGFSPSRTRMDFKPRARLEGMALARVNEFLITESLYQVDNRKKHFSIFLLPKMSDFDPTTMGEMYMVTWKLRAALVDGYNVILWRDDNWYVVFVTDISGQEMRGILEFILRKEWNFHMN